MNKKNTFLVATLSILVIAVVVLFLKENTKPFVASSFKGVYGILEQNQWNIYASDLDGSQKKLIIGLDGKDFERSRPRGVLGAQLSPNGEYLLYNKLYKEHDPLWIIRTDGQKNKAIVNIGSDERLKEFFWSPDSQKIIYHLYKIF